MSLREITYQEDKFADMMKLSLELALRRKDILRD
jgi:hypothetical protein